MKPTPYRRIAAYGLWKHYFLCQKTSSSSSKLDLHVTHRNFLILCLIISPYCFDFVCSLWSPKPQVFREQPHSAAWERLTPSPHPPFRVIAFNSLILESARPELIIPANAWQNNRKLCGIVKEIARYIRRAKLETVIRILLWNNQHLLVYLCRGRRQENFCLHRAYYCTVLQHAHGPAAIYRFTEITQIIFRVAEILKLYFVSIRDLIRKQNCNKHCVGRCMSYNNKD